MTFVVGSIKDIKGLALLFLARKGPCLLKTASCACAAAASWRIYFALEYKVRRACYSWK